MYTSMTDCARARESVSADLDGELQELEIRRLQAHLRHCAECATWAEVAQATTTELRESAREAPAAAVFEPVLRGRRRRLGAALVAAPVAALVAGAVVSLGAVHHRLAGSQRMGRTPVAHPDRWIAPGSLGVDTYLPPVLPYSLRAV